MGVGEGGGEKPLHTKPRAGSAGPLPCRARWPPPAQRPVPTPGKPLTGHGKLLPGLGEAPHVKGIWKKSWQPSHSLRDRTTFRKEEVSVERSGQPLVQRSEEALLTSLMCEQAQQPQGRDQPHVPLPEQPLLPVPTSIAHPAPRGVAQGTPVLAVAAASSSCVAGAGHERQRSTGMR